MTFNILLLLLLNFAFIGILPRLFFKRGSFNAMWWLTGTPFIACAAVLILVHAGILVVPGVVAGYGSVLETVAMLFSVASFCLIAFTLGTHRVPLALWHQEDDAPRSIVTYGAYGKIRHPFYAAFLLAFIGAFVCAPHIGTLLCLVAGFTILNFTAAREERRLAASEFGTEYRDYMRRTGRFIPKFYQAGKS
jgi:protein-S-isoprenylcysteine O-methyltransferase Ste14